MVASCLLLGGCGSLLGADFDHGPVDGKRAGSSSGSGTSGSDPFEPPERRAHRRLRQVKLGGRSRYRAGVGHRNENGQEVEVERFCMN